MRSRWVFRSGEGRDGRSKGVEDKCMKRTFDDLVVVLEVN
jgi:hypothetical protein